MHVLGTGVPRCLGVARSASSPKAAQALGRSLTPRLQISFGRVTCMALAASVPGPWTLHGFPTVVWQLCLGLGFAVTPLILAGVLGVCAWVWVLFSPHHSWLGFVVCAVGLGFWLAPRHSWLGFWGVCRCVCALRLYAATPGWGVRCGCVCLGFGSRLRPVYPGWVVGVYVCLCARSACTAPLLAGLCGVVVFGLEFRLRPATPGWGVGVCLCLSARSVCIPPLVAGVCGVGVCAWAWVSTAPRHLSLGYSCVCLCVCVRHRLCPATPGWDVRSGCACLGSGFGCAPPLLAGVLGCVCQCAPSACTPQLLARGCGVWVWCGLAPVPVPWLVAGCARFPGLRHPVAVFAWHLSVCLGCGRQRASLACLVAPRWCAAPRPVWSLSVLRSAFPDPVAWDSGITGRLRGARGGRPRTGLFVPAAGSRRGRGAGLAPCRTRSGPRDGVVPGGSLRHRSWAACAVVVCVCGPGH